MQKQSNDSFLQVAIEEARLGLAEGGTLIRATTTTGVQSSEQRRWSALALIWISVAFCGCGKPADIAEKSAARTTVEPSASAAPSISEARIKEFAEHLTNAAESQDFEACGRLIDGNAIFDRATADLEFLYVHRDRTLQQWREAIVDSLMLSSSVALPCAVGATLRVVNCDLEKNQATFRSLMPDGGVTYFILHLIDKNGVVVADSFSVLGAAGPWESSFMDTVKPFAAFEGENGRISPQAPNAEELVRNKTHLYKMLPTMAEGNFDEVLWLYEQLPESFQRSEYPLLLAISAAVEQAFDSDNEFETEYLAAKADILLARYQESVAGSNAICLLECALANKLGDEERIRTSLKDIRQLTGDDPFLRAHEAFAAIRQGKPDAARQAAEQSLKAVDYNIIPYLAVYAAAQAQNDEERAQEMADVILTEFNSELEALAQRAASSSMILPPKQVESILTILGVPDDST
jgi:hypothetical protein